MLPRGYIDEPRPKPEPHLFTVPIPSRVVVLSWNGQTTQRLGYVAIDMFTFVTPVQLQKEAICQGVYVISTTHTMLPKSKSWSCTFIIQTETSSRRLVYKQKIQTRDCRNLRRANQALPPGSLPFPTSSTTIQNCPQFKLRPRRQTNLNTRRGKPTMTRVQQNTMEDKPDVCVVLFIDYQKQKNNFNWG